MHTFLAQTKRIPILLTYIYFFKLCGQYIVDYASFVLADNMLSLMWLESRVSYYRNSKTLFSTKYIYKKSLETPLRVLNKHLF